MSATKTTPPEPIRAPLDLAGLLSHLCATAQPNVTEAQAQWFAEASTLADSIGSHAARLCEVLAEREPLDGPEQAHTFYLLGNVFSLLAGLANVGQEMAHTHQTRVAERNENPPRRVLNAP